VELINTPTTDPQVLDDLEAFVTSGLGKGVVRAKDTPNFIANRVGIAGMLATMKEVENFGLTYDVVDDLTGKKLGRASSGTFRTADVVGLDTMAHVIKTLQDNLNETDPFYGSFGTPAVLKPSCWSWATWARRPRPVSTRRSGAMCCALTWTAEDYVPGGEKADEVYGRMLKKPAAERLKLLRNAEGAQGQFLWAILRNSFHYAAVHLATIAETARDVDLAMRWGFGMKQGPFELWQEAGWLEVAKMVQEDIDAGKALCKAPLPDWVFKGPVADGRWRAHAAGSWNPTAGKFERAARCPCTSASISPRCAGQQAPTPALRPRQDAARGRRDPPVDAGRRGGDRQHQDQDARHQPRCGRGPEAGRGPGREGLPGRGDLVGRRALQRRRRPAGHAAGLHDGWRERHRRAPSTKCSRPCCACATPTCRWSRPSAAWRWAAAASWPCTRTPRGRHGKLHRPGGSGRGPGARRRWPDLHRAPRGRECRRPTNKDLLPFLTEGFTAAAMAKVGTSALESASWAICWTAT
jgi:3-hydroxyacyl-CoA dehydrogenase